MISCIQDYHVCHDASNTSGPRQRRKDQVPTTVRLTSSTTIKELAYLMPGWAKVRGGWVLWGAARLLLADAESTWL